MTIHLREIVLEQDAEAIAAILSTIESEPVAPQRVREWDAHHMAGQVVYRVGAVDAGGALLGYGSAVTGPWLPSGHYGVYAAVQPAMRRRGIGALLYDDVARFARQHGAGRLRSEVRDNDQASMHFARRRGFTIERHVFESALDLAAFDIGPWLPAIEHARAQHIRFFSLAEIDDNENMHRLLYALNRQLVLDIPGSSQFFPPFEDFEHFLFGASWYRPDGQIIAADGDDWIGMAAVSFNPEQRSSYNNITGVLASHRGRGIAQALKILAIQRARAHGALNIRTNNNAENAPMLAINRKLGYQPLPGEYMLWEQVDAHEQA
jgi:GNAT superfamily N-acetyltransferase